MVNYIQRIGQYATRNGRPLMKSVALMIEEKGTLVHWKDKPGWVNGVLKNPDKYDEWLKHITF